MIIMNEGFQRAAMEYGRGIREDAAPRRYSCDEVKSFLRSLKGWRNGIAVEVFVNIDGMKVYGQKDNIWDCERNVLEGYMILQECRGSRRAGQGYVYIDDWGNHDLTLKLTLFEDVWCMFRLADIRVGEHDDNKVCFIGPTKPRSIDGRPIPSQQFFEYRTVQLISMTLERSPK